ncbi:MAG: hypothetical protein K9H26_02690 [Prolixibacteraceae bacterium]|nr:hypothetical protein [Prolixibacteraceae bacterium]
MKNLKIYLVMALFSFSAVVFNSCSNEDELINSNDLKIEECPNILYFENNTEVLEELHYISTLSFDEKINWANKKGFNSFGIEATKFYNTIDPEGFKGEEEIYDFIHQNSKYIELVEREGEYYVEQKYYSNPYRFIVNEDQLYQIGDTIYKLLDECRISTSINNLDKLEIIDDNNIESFIKDSDIIIIKPFLNNLKGASSICSLGGYGESEELDYNGKTYKTTVHMYVESEYSNLYGWFVHVSGDVCCKVKGFLGFWYNHSTGIWSDLEYVVRYKKYYGGYYYATSSDSWNDFENPTTMVDYDEYFYAHQFGSTNPDATFVSYRLKGRTYVPGSEIEISD